MGHTFRRSLPAVWLGTLLALFGGGLWMLPARAGTGLQIALPSAGVKPQRGLQLDVDTRWLDGSGYRPIRLRLSTIGNLPSAADRTVQVSLSSTYWNESTPTVRSTVAVRLAQGSSFTEQTVLMPMTRPAVRFQVEVTEDGRICRDLSTWEMVHTGTSEWTEVYPTLLIVDAAAPPLGFTAFGPLARVSTASTSGGAAPFQPPFGPAARLSEASTAAGAEEIFDVRRLVAACQGGRSTVVAESDTGEPIRSTELLNFINMVPTALVVPPGSLPESWLGLTAVDLLTISWTELARLSREDPVRSEAIRQWVWSGGTLLLWGLEATDERLAEVEAEFGVSQLPDYDPATGLGLPSAPPAAAAPTAATVPHSAGDVKRLRGWSVAEPHHVHAKVHFLDETQAGTLSPRASDKAWDPGDHPGLTEEESVSKLRSAFCFREAGLGQLVAIFESNPFPGEQALWATILNAVGPAQWCHVRRQGFSVQRNNPDFWDWLIPGIGKTPAKAFVVLISLFVMVIGPVNYYVLLRKGRLALLLVTVPTLALLVTLGLLTFSLAWEGLGVRCRTRSITQIDASQGQAISWSRQTYYAGLSPSGGLIFPADAAVYPIDYRGSLNNRPSFRDRTLIWSELAEPSAGTGLASSTNRPAVSSASASTRSEPPITSVPITSMPITSMPATSILADRASANAPGTLSRFAPRWQQRLAWGYLPARTYRQFVVIEPRPTSARIVVKESAGTIRVRNELGVAIERLVLRARSGKLYATEKLAAGAESIAQPIDPVLAESSWSSVLAANSPALPAGIRPSDLEGSPGVFSSRYYVGSSNDDNFGEPNLTLARAEARFRALFTNRFSGLHVGTYVAQTEDGPLVSRGVTKWRSGYDFHVVFGSW